MMDKDIHISKCIKNTRSKRAATVPFILRRMVYLSEMTHEFRTLKHLLIGALLTFVIWLLTILELTAVNTESGHYGQDFYLIAHNEHVFEG